MTGCLNKRRFSLKYPDGRIERYGDCNPQSDDRREIMQSDGKFYLHHISHGNLASTIGSVELPAGTEWTNGYYDTEHDGWKPMEEWK